MAEQARLMIVSYLWPNEILPLLNRISDRAEEQSRTEQNGRKWKMQTISHLFTSPALEEDDDKTQGFY